MKILKKRMSRRLMSLLFQMLSPKLTKQQKKMRMKTRMCLLYSQLKSRIYKIYQSNSKTAKQNSRQPSCLSRLPREARPQEGKQRKRSGAKKDQTTPWVSTNSDK